MRAMVTGAAGFIGSNLCRFLLEAGHTVVGLDSLLSGVRQNVPVSGRLEFVEGDVRDADLVGHKIKGCDAVFHLAASVGNKRSIDEPVLDADINTVGTVQLLQAARHANVKKVVISSSAGIFGELKTLPIAEDHPLDPDTPYGASKLFQEKVGLAYSKLFGIEVVCLRYFNVYGPNQRFDAYGNVIPIFVFKMLRGEPLTIYGDGEQTRDFVNVRDVVAANVAAALASGLSGAFNIGSGGRVTINRLVQLIGSAGEMQPTVNFGPARPGDVRHSLADISAASRAFGYSPSVDLRAGLQEYVSWARSEVESVSV